MSVSIAPAGGATMGKVVIGAVAVLAVGIGVAVGSFLVANRTAAVGSGASYVPASAPFYAEWRLDPSTAQDAALRELLGRFPAIEGIDLERPLYAQLTERLDEMLTEKGASVSWNADVAPWFDGRVGMALLDVPLDAMSSEAPAEELAVPSMVVLVGVTDRAAAEAAIERLIAEAEEPPTLTEQTHAGVTIRVAADEGAYAVAADQLLIAPSADDIIAALDAHDAGATTLAEVEEITRLTDALPADWLGFGIYDFTDLMAAALDEAGTEEPEMTEAFRALLENQSLRGAVAFTAGGDRLAIDVASDPPTGALAVENAERGLAGEVPADVLYYSEGGDLGSSFAAVITPMKGALEATPEGAEQIDTLEAALGADLEELVEWIGDGAMAFGFDGSEPYGGLVLVPTDMEAAERRLSQLASFAELAALDPSSGVTVEESQVESETVTTIRWQDAGAGTDPMMPVPTGVTVQYAVTDDRALVGLGESFVGRVLELDSADALASQARFSSAIDELGGTSNSGVAWLDITGVREAVETAMGPAIAMFDGGDVYESEIKPWLLPLDRFVAVTRVEGDLLVQRTALLVE